MTSPYDANRLHTQLAKMIALEAAIEEQLGELIDEVPIHASVTAVLRDFQAMARAQRQALETRLRKIADAVPSSQGSTPILLVERLSR